MRILVRSVFGLASLQDSGRSGYRRFGVPDGGAFDRESFHLANALLGNELDDPVIEFALGTMEFEALTGGCVSVVGASSGVTVGGSQSSCNTVLNLKKGDLVTVAPPKRGLRTYVGVPGGFVARESLGSVSGAVVEAKAELSSAEERAVPGRQLAELPSSLSERPLRALLNEVDGTWTDAAYTVGRSIDRVGLRLEGPKPMIDPASGRSEPSVFGAVQLTEDRTLIVHGPDGPTIGGYIKLGGVVRADLDRVGQLAPGDAVRFVRVTMEEAREAWRELEVRQRGMFNSIRVGGNGA